MIKLGTVVLNKGVVWADQFGAAQIAEEEFFDVDGGANLQWIPITMSGQTITLTAAGSDSGGIGMFTKAQLDYVRSLELSQEVVQFTYGSIVVDVTVKANPLDVTSLRKMYGHTADDVFYGSIKLRGA